MAEGHSQGCASQWVFNHSAPALPLLSKEGAFSRIYVVLYSKSIRLAIRGTWRLDLIDYSVDPNPLGSHARFRSLPLPLVEA